MMQFQTTVGIKNLDMSEFQPVKIGRLWNGLYFEWFSGSFFPAFEWLDAIMVFTNQNLDQPLS